MILPTWFLLTIFSLLFLTMAELMQKLAMDDKQDISAETNNFYGVVVQTVFAFLIAALTGNLLNISELNPEQWFFFAFVGINSFWAGKFFYNSYKGNAIGISAILQTVSVAVSTSIGIVFLNEGTEFSKFIGIALIMLSIIVLNFIKRKNSINTMSPL